MKRTPRNYDGKEPTGRQIRDILPEIMSTLSRKMGDQPERIICAWPEIVGDKIAKMTRAVHFDAGVLKVLVKNSTLFSLLIEHEKPRLVAAFQRKFPKVCFQDILFKIG